MKNLLLLLASALLAASCVDKSYDLNGIDTDEIAIGGDGSEFRIPLATVTVALHEIARAGTDIRTLFDDIDTWLPSTLPGNADHVDIPRLRQAAYVSSLFDALYAEMGSSTAKREAMADLLWRKHRNEFLPLLTLAGSDETAFKNAFVAQYANAAIRSEVERQFGLYLRDLDTIEPLHYDLGALDIDDSVVDMLADNLDPEGTAAPKNTLHLYGTIGNGLPLAVALHPALRNTGIDFATAAEPGENAIAEQRLFAEDLRTLAAGTDLTIPVALQKYYPGRGFDDSHPIRIRLSLVKRGALKLEL